ncbi:MAG: FHA domain-containing protein [Solirubrobacterales bacterium]
MSKEREIPTRDFRSNATIITRGAERKRRGKENRIFTSARPDAVPESFESGTIPGSGTFFCVDCGSHLSLLESDVLPACPGCSGSFFRRDSIFEPMQEHGDATSEFSARSKRSEPAWLHEARTMLPGPGRFLAFLADEETIRIFPLEPGWTRIGRSAAADLRLDDPSVSRRHALIVSEAPKSLRILNDRSLNGVQVNGETIEWARLGDGDALEIGAYTLYVLES